MLVALMCGAMALAPAVSQFGASAKTQSAGSAQANGLSNIKKLDYGNAPSINTEDYFDNNVVRRLSDNIKSDREISVIVSTKAETILDKYEEANAEKHGKTVGDFVNSPEGVKAGSKIRSEIATLKNRISKANFDSSFGEEYDVLLSGFEVVIKAKDFNKLSSVVGNDATLIVGEEYERCESEVIDNIVDIDETTGIFNSTGSKYTGSGTVIAVLDTGLDYTHTAFDPERFEGAEVMTLDTISEVIDGTRASSMVGGLNANDVYVNKKVPFAFDYADKDSDVFPLDSSHGTHVSGVMVGNDDTIRGVAPNAQLASMKVFSDSSEQGARQSWIVAALEDCVTLGVDVINMSLGSSCGFSNSQDDEEIEKIYSKIHERGISLVTAASNDYNSFLNSEKNGNLGLTSNPDSATAGAPSTFPAALSVASVSGTKTPYFTYGESIIYFNEASNRAAKPKEFVNEILGDAQSKEFEYVTIPGVGRSSDYSGIDVAGKIALVHRGSTSFEDKVRIASRCGAAGVIIRNNVSGEISMTIGNVDFPACSISQDDGNMLAAQPKGTIKIAKSQVAGPFMSDFSSWGPTPDLKIKPEITAHGGNILSSVPGQRYDRLSGTSMASPNQAGVTALVRQYVKERFESENLSAVDVTSRVNQLMMSTADIVYNTNGLPYAVRKQGSGLANLAAATSTPAYITTLDKSGEIMDKAKLEIGDDAKKSGVYEMSFYINNISSQSLTYDIGGIVMTEGVSETKTVRGDTTVTEQGYKLEAALEVVSVNNGGTRNGNTVTVNANKSLKVDVKITLTDNDKDYLNKSFANGMYIEGFVTATAKDGTTVNLNVPYLAFYGDWNQAPIFDLDYFETDPSDKDGTDQDQKIMADIVATRPIGGLYQDYIAYLGSYMFSQAPGAKQIAADRDKIALTNQTGEEGGVNSLNSIWAGMLRGADHVDISITDTVTGEVIFERTEYNVRKSFHAGASAIDIEFELANYNLKNNTRYHVLFEAYTPYGDGGAAVNKRNTFDFTFTTDFEAPTVTDCNFYTEYDASTKKTRLYAKIDIYDNHYSQAMAIGTITPPASLYESYGLELFDRYLTPLYSSNNSTYTVTYELTDYIDLIKKSYNGNSFFVQVYDYASNAGSYEITIPDEITEIYNFLDKNGKPIGDELVLAPNEIYNIDVSFDSANDAWMKTLSFKSADPTVADVVNGKIIARSVGETTLTATSNSDKTVVKTITIRVEDNGVKYDKPVTDSFTLTEYKVNKAFYFSSYESRNLGITGDTYKFTTNSLSFYPSESITVKYDLKAYFPDDVKVEFKTSNEKVAVVDEKGTITAKAEGSATISVRVLMDGKSTYYSQTIVITVKDPYSTNGAYLIGYYGDGESIDGVDHVVNIRKDLGLEEISAYAFSNYEFVPKDENDEITKEDPYKSKQVPIGENTIKKVIIPEGVKVIGPYAFAKLTALEEVVLPSTLNQIQSNAFYGCTKLKTINLENVQFINMNAFRNCPIEELSLDSVVAIGNNAFSFDVNVKDADGNAVTSVLKKLVLPESAQSVGAAAFFNNVALTSVYFRAYSVKLGEEVFAYCEELTQVTNLNTSVIPASAFTGCKKLTSINIGADVQVIGRYAFMNTGITKFTLSSNEHFKVSSDGRLLMNENGTTLVLVAPDTRSIGGDSAELSSITKIGDGAFSGNANLRSVNLPNVTYVGSYAFAECTSLAELNLGELTYIGEGAFGYCAKLSGLPEFGTGLKEIGQSAFLGCTSLHTVIIPDGVTVGATAFYGCNGLEYVKLGNNVVVGDAAFFTDLKTEEKSLGSQDGSTFVYENPTSDGKIKKLEAGENVVFGSLSFAAQFKLDTVTLGAGAKIGDSAFFLDSAITEIDLSKALEIGEEAFSGTILTVYEVYESQVRIAGYLTYDMSLTTLDLSSATKLGAGAFTLNTKLTEVTLGSGLKEIPEYAFAYAELLSDINLDKVESIGASAFVGAAALQEVDLSGAEYIGQNAFGEAASLQKVVFGDGVIVAATAFYGATQLDTVNFDKVLMIGDYAFAATAVESADLSNVIYIGDYAFMNTKLSSVKFGPGLAFIGENPFARCAISEFTDKDGNNTFKISESVEVDGAVTDGVFVEDGVLYKQSVNGLQLVSYPVNKADVDYKVKDGTIRISAMAFLDNKNIVSVHLPYALKAIGDKAFFGCEELTVVVFNSVSAPILEEAYDQSYSEDFRNLPMTGYYGGREGNDAFKGMGLIPYYMWNADPTVYFYGSNFINYVGKQTKPLVFVTPSNGLYYDAFVISQYYSSNVKGGVAPYEATLEVIAIIDELPASINISLNDEAQVVAARAAYESILQIEQRALVTNYSKLTAAEDTIEYLKINNGEGNDDPPEPEPEKNNLLPLVITFGVLTGVFFLATAALTVVLVLNLRRKNNKNPN